jgi:hypothetical protein
LNSFRPLGDNSISTQDSAVKRWLNRTVAGAGLTSALGDFCYETLDRG